MQIFIADDQIQVRSAVRLRLEQEPGFELAGEAADTTGLLAGLVDNLVEVVLLDWELPGLATDHLMRLLRYEHPSVLVVAMSSHPEARKHSLAAGSDAFLSKSEPPEVMLATLRQLSPVAKDLDQYTEAPDQ